MLARNRLLKYPANNPSWSKRSNLDPEVTPTNDDPTFIAVAFDFDNGDAGKFV